MLENRSFDHLFGFAGIPGVEQLDPDAHENAIDRSDPSRGNAKPGDEGSHILAMDPPHSHKSAQQQMGRIASRSGRRATYRMDGFADAYRAKLVGQEHLPVFHWPRIWFGALGLGLLGSMAARAVRHHATDGGWRTLGLWIAVFALVAASLLWRRPLYLAAGVLRIAGAIIAAAVIFGAAADGIMELIRSPRWFAAWWLLGGAFVASILVVVGRRRDAKKRRAPTPDQQDQAALQAPSIMRCMPPEHVKVLGELAREYAVCTAWHSSVPGATWPNRNFMHAATSGQSVDIEVGLYDDVTVFEMLEDERKHHSDEAPPRDAWRIYFDGVPQVIVFEHLLTDERSAQWRVTSDLYTDIKQGDLPSYVFVEPRHSHGKTNSYHPGNNETASNGSSDFARGESLVRSIYLALKENEDLFKKTLLVITFDEHGGLFDRASPPRTVHPNAASAVRHPQTTTRRLVAWFVEQQNSPFDFKRLGMRVPAIVISPYIEKQVVPDVFDHTSVIATLRDLFAPHQQPLTKRDRRARPFWDLVLNSERVSLPDVPDPGYPPEGGSDSDKAPDSDIGRAGGRAKEGPPTTGGTLSQQLDHVTPFVGEVLDQRGAPPAPSVAEAEAAEELEEFIAPPGIVYSDEIAARVAAWTPGRDRPV